MPGTCTISESSCHDHTAVCISGIPGSVKEALKKTEPLQASTGSVGPLIESMEGAAVFYVCNWLGIPCYQVRAVSNFVEPRDSSKWNIPLALENLKEALLNVLKKLTVPVN